MQFSLKLSARCVCRFRGNLLASFLSLLSFSSRLTVLKRKITHFQLFFLFFPTTMFVARWTKNRLVSFFFFVVVWCNLFVIRIWFIRQKKKKIIFIPGHQRFEIIEWIHRRRALEILCSDYILCYKWIWINPQLYVLIMIAREIKLRENRRCVKKNTQRLWMLVHLWENLYA